MRTLIFIGILISSFSALIAQSAEEEMIRLKQGVEGVVVEGHRHRDDGQPV